MWNGETRSETGRGVGAGGRYHSDTRQKCSKTLAYLLDIQNPPQWSLCQLWQWQMLCYLPLNCTRLSRRDRNCSRAAQQTDWKEKKIFISYQIALDVIFSHFWNANCTIAIYNDLIGAMVYSGKKKQVGQEGMQGFYFILTPMQENASLMSH